MILSLGSNGSGQLGISHFDDAFAPTEVTGPTCIGSVRTIAAGGNHTLLLSGEQVYAAGENGDGRCNIRPSPTALNQRFAQYQQTPGPLSSDGWKLCAATWAASTLVSNQNEVFTCGTGNRGELGQGDGITRSTELCKIPDFPPTGLEIVDVAACMSHTVAVLSNGDVYAWGSGRKGQLGSPAIDCWKPRRIQDIPFKAVRATCGRDFTYIVGRPDFGLHVILGADKWQVRSDAPNNVLNWKQIGASWGSIFILLQNGDLLSWGRDDHGQLSPSGLPSIEHIAIGSEHALALTTSGTVLAWGWGEHGNCGQPTDTDGDVKGRWNELSAPKQCLFIGAGCATSWIVCKDPT